MDERGTRRSMYEDDVSSSMVSNRGDKGLELSSIGNVKSRGVDSEAVKE